VQRRGFLLGAGAVAGGLSAGASALLPRDRTEADAEVADPRRGMQEIIWSVPTGEPVAALTFDDGPHPDLTPHILDVLDRYDVKATFMVMGYAAESYPDLLVEVVSRGHEIGNHTWSHLHVAKTSATTARSEIERGTHVLEDVAGVPVGLFRPPQGRLNEAVVRLATNMRQDIVLWSVQRGEKRWRSSRSVARHVIDDAGPGDIINLHDGIGRGTFEPASVLAHTLMGRRLVELDALPRIIEGLQQRRMRVVPVSELRYVANRAAET